MVAHRKDMLDSDLADLYQVTTGNLNLAIKRDRGPCDTASICKSKRRPWPALESTCTEPQSYSAAWTVRYILLEPPGELWISGIAMEDPPQSSPTRAHPGSDHKRSELLLKCGHRHDERQKTLCGVLESALDHCLKLNLVAFE